MKRIVLISLLAVALTGCATVTFKRGAGPGGAKTDEDACRAESASQAAYVECLRERGWLVAGRGASPKPAAASKPATPVAASSKPVPPPAAATAPAASPTRAGAPPPAAAPTEPALTETAAEEALDPKTRLHVSSWWKLGGTAADLDRAVAACVDELGADHRPNPAATEVTVALRDCLRGKKWFPVGGTGPL